MSNTLQTQTLFQMTAKSTLIAFVMMASAFTSQSAFAGSPVYVGIQTPQTVSIDTISHAPWDAILKKYVDKDGMVNYRDLKANHADITSLNQYLVSLSGANPNVPAKREAKLAFWINAYNAVTVHGILREYPTTSIRNHTAKAIGYNIWHDLKLFVGGTPYSLDSVEHKVLRKMGEPRIHFGIVCASIGCPRLLNEAYTADKLNDQFELNSKYFFSRSQNFRYDANGRRFYMSAIMDWFGGDFGSSQADQLRRISGWLPTAAAQSAATQNAVSISYLDYDWKLNTKN